MPVARIKTLIASKKDQLTAFLGLFLGILTLTGILTYIDGSVFERFTGRLNPLVAIFGAGILGLGLLSWLMYREWFSVYHRDSPLMRRLVAGLTGVFASIAILVDLNLPFPENINVSFPKSLLFYPAIGFFAEVVFHVLPLSFLLFCLDVVFRNKNRNLTAAVLSCIVLVAIIEPTYQAFFMDEMPRWALVSTWVNIFLFSFTQLMTFSRSGFIPMYLMRLLYYLIWHIGWGAVRLNLLF